MADTAAEALDAICPGIVGNPWLGGHWPHPQQYDFLQRSLEGSISLDPDDVYEALFGGAAGGGKSDAVLMAAGQMAWLYPGSSSVLIRRTMPELTKPGALLNRALKWWTEDLGIKWSEKRGMFAFPNGSQVQVGYHHHPKHDAQYQGGEYQLVIFDELTYFPTNEAWLHLRSRMRRPEGSAWPLRLLSTSNPGGPGHVWVKNRFVGGSDPITGEAIAPAYPYFPSRLDDNPSLDRRAYARTLEHLLPARRDQLLHGDWDAKDPGDYFRAEWFGPLLDPDKDKWPAGDCIRVRSWDLAASEKESASETAGVLMARHSRGVRAVEHCISFRLTPGARDGRIVQVAQADGPTVVQYLEVEPGSGGIAQVLGLEEKLKAAGCRVVYARPKMEMSRSEAERLAVNPEHAKGKVGRAIPVSTCLYRGHVQRGECPDTGDPWWGVDRGKATTSQSDGIRLFAGAWTQAYLDDMEPFPVMLEGNSQKIVRADKTDATTGAWSYTEAHKPGGNRAGREIKPHTPAELQNVHPADRPDVSSKSRDRGGHWRP